MILRRLHVEHFRCHNVPVDIEFDERLTIVAGLNEAGKTTLFDALRYALFRRSGATGRDIDALAPWDTDGLPPTVGIDFEHGGAEYQLRKTWGRRGGTRLARRNAGGILVPDMAENADDFLARMFAGELQKQGQFAGFTGQQMGLAYLLFVPQGNVPISGDAKEIGLHVDARARLTEIIGTASQDPRAARIGKKIADAYDQLFTKAGKRCKNNTAARIAERIAALEGDIAGKRERIASLERVAEALETAEREATNAGAAAEAASKAAELNRPRFQAAVELRAVLETNEHELSRARERYDALMQESQLRESTLRQLEEMRPVREKLAADVVAAKGALSESERDRVAAATAFENATVSDPELEFLERQLSAAQDAAMERQRVESLARDVDRAVQIESRLAEIDAQCATSVRFTESDAEKLRDLIQSERDLQTRLGLVETSLTITAEQDLSIVWRSSGSEERRVLPAGERVEISADSRLALQIEGIADFEVRGPINDAGELRTQLSNCRRRLSELNSQFGTVDPFELQQRLATRQLVERERARLLPERDGLLGGKSFDNVRRALADQQSRLASAPNDRTAAELGEGIAERRAARDSLIARLREEAQSAAARVVEFRDALTTARNAGDAREDEWRRLETQLAKLQRDGESESDRQRMLNDAYTKRFEAQREFEAARDAYEPYRNDGDPLTQLTRLEDEADRSVRVEFEKKSRARDLKAELDDGFAAAPESELNGLEEELNRLRAQLADEECTEEAVKMLQKFVVEADARRVEAFARPVLERVAPWFREVTGTELLDLGLGSDNQVTGLRLGGVRREVRFEELSQGTCDQLALLIRLGFASLLTLPACLGRMPVLLDDPLVHADWQRRPRFLSVLEEVSSTAQVIVFTCRPEDYKGLAAGFVNLDSSSPQQTVAAVVA